MRLRYALPLLLISSLAIAQQQQPPSTPIEQALRFKLANEMEASIQCNVAIVGNQQALESARRDLTKALARVSELEVKLKDAAPSGEPK